MNFGGPNEADVESVSLRSRRYFTGFHTTRTGCLEQSGIDDVEVVTLTAIVDRIDLEKRRVTLTLDDGKTKTYKVTQAAQNLDQVQPGDHVKSTATEEFMVAVNKSGESPTAASVGEVNAAPRSSKPGAVMVETAAMSGKSLAIDSEKRKVTLLDADGKKKTVKVRPSIDLSRLATEFELTSAPLPSSDREFAVQTRSIVELMQIMAAQVEIPPEDQSQHRAFPGFEAGHDVPAGNHDSGALRNV